MQRNTVAAGLSGAMKGGLRLLYAVEVRQGTRGARVHVIGSYLPRHPVNGFHEGVHDSTAWALERCGLARVEAGTVSLTNDGRTVAAALVEELRTPLPVFAPAPVGRHLRLAVSAPDETELDADVSARQRERRRRVMAAMRHPGAPASDLH